MTCFYPIKAYRSKAVTANGKRQLVFSSKDSTGDVVEISCGQCMGCRLKQSGNWAIRISQESSLYEKNCFITLTYSSENLPPYGSLDVRDFQLFMKRLRERYVPPMPFFSTKDEKSAWKLKNSIRFFHCGEYGEQLGRPHYHACLLNFDFPDKYHFRDAPTGEPVYRSPALEELWPHGNSEIGSLTFESAGYVARYVTKKITGPMAVDHYSRVDPDTGEIITLKPEYTTMSRNPGIGAPWLEKFHTDVYPHDAVTLLGGKKIPPPKFYNGRYEIMYPQKYAVIKEKRSVKQWTDICAKLRDNTPERLKVKEIVKLKTIQTLTRKMEK